MALNSVLGKLLFAREPELPELRAIELGDMQKKAVENNQRVLPEAMRLGRDVNKYNQELLDESLDRALPGYRGMRDEAGSKISSWLKGEIPEDISALVQNNAAARALGGGYAGSGQGRNLLARDLGLTSMDVVGRGLSAFERWTAVGSRFMMAPQFDVTSMFVSPMQQAQFDVSERNQRWNYDWFKAQLDAQPKGWEQALDQVFTWLEETGTSIASSYMGGAMGGMGGGGGAGKMPDYESMPGGGTGPSWGGGGYRGSFDPYIDESWGYDAWSKNRAGGGASVGSLGGGGGFGGFV